MRAYIVRLGRELDEQNCADHVCETHSKIPAHYKFSTAYFVYYDH